MYDTTLDPEDHCPICGDLLDAFGECISSCDDNSRFDYETYYYQDPYYSFNYGISE